MRRVLVVTWALGTASGVLLGLFGVQLVSSRFSTSRVSPLSHPEVVSALQAARSVPVSAEEIALPAGPAPDTAVPPPSPPVDAAPARPSAGATSTPAPAPRASSLPRPGVTAGTLADTAVAAAVPPTTVTAPSPPGSSSTSTTATTVKETPSTAKPNSDGKGSGRTTTTTAKKTTTTTAKPGSSKDSGSRDESAGETKTIRGDWGVVVVTFSEGKVRRVWSRPNAGYEVHPVSDGPDYVLVYFDKGNRGYRVWASYYRGEPFTDVTRCSGAWPRPDCRG